MCRCKDLAHCVYDSRVASDPSALHSSTKPEAPKWLHRQTLNRHFESKPQDPITSRLKLPNPKLQALRVIENSTAQASTRRPKTEPKALKSELYYLDPKSM